MLGWGEYYALLPFSELDRAAKDASPESGAGQYPDALWFHHGREDLHGFQQRLRDRHAEGRLEQFGGCWGWTRCRIGRSKQPGMVSMSLPGVRHPIEVAEELVFLGEDFRVELERRAGSPPPLPTVDDVSEYVPRHREHALRRDLATMDMVLGLLDGAPPVDTMLEPRLKRKLRERERREVKHVSAAPTGLEQMLKWVRTPRKNAKRGSSAIPLSAVSGEVLPGDMVLLKARLAPDCRRMLHGKPKPSKVPRLTGVVAQPPLPWEERSFEIRQPTPEEEREAVELKKPTAWDLAHGLLAMCEGIDLDFHRSATAVASEVMRTGRFAVSVLALHRLRGGEGKPGQMDRARYSRHLEIMQRLEVEVDLPDGRNTLAIPFVAGGMRVRDTVTGATQAASFHAVPDSLVGMMLAEGGHRWQYWLDSRVVRLEDELAYSLHHVFARQWAARMVRNAVHGDTRQAWNLATLLDATSLRKWRERMVKQGKPWLRRRVEEALSALNGIGLYGAAGTATVEWNERDITSSKVLFGEPPPHILEAHADRNSRRIEGAKKKRQRLEAQGEGRQGRKGKAAG